MTCKDRCFVEGDGTEHTSAVAFGRLYLVFGCITSAHFAIVADAHTGHLEDYARDDAEAAAKTDPVKFPGLAVRGAMLRSVAADATEEVLDPSGEHHSRPEVVFRRQAPGASCCIDPDCDLSGGYAHVGPCEPCSCPMHHASWECPLRPGCYELTYRLFYGVSGTKVHVVRAQIERIERAFGKVQWTVSKTWSCAVAWFKGDPVAFTMGCRKDKPEVEELNAINSIGEG
jgi:hypothetical protein